jgi:hypothetical protein
VGSRRRKLIAISGGCFAKARFRLGGPAFVKLNIEAFRHIAFQKPSFVFCSSFPGKWLQLVQVHLRSARQEVISHLCASAIFTYWRNLAEGREACHYNTVKLESRVCCSLVNKSVL